MPERRCEQCEYESRYKVDRGQPPSQRATRPKPPPFSVCHHAAPRNRRTSSPYPVRHSSYGVDHPHGRRFEGKVPCVVLAISLFGVETGHTIAPFLFALGLLCLRLRVLAATGDRTGREPSHTSYRRAHTGGFERAAKTHVGVAPTLLAPAPMTTQRGCRACPWVVQDHARPHYREDGYIVNIICLRPQTGEVATYAILPVSSRKLLDSRLQVVSSTRLPKTAKAKSANEGRKRANYLCHPSMHPFSVRNSTCLRQAGR